ncbi:rod shape-determining protein MreC, partial [Escherichia coli]|nr:rod shape-determining protein MreC [Escherichia coli]
LMQMMPQVLPAPDAMGPPAPVPAPATGLTQPLPDAPPPPQVSGGGQ